MKKTNVSGKEQFELSKILELMGVVIILYLKKGVRLGAHFSLHPCWPRELVGSPFRDWGSGRAASLRSSAHVFPAE